jgi:hypothetical protein
MYTSMQIARILNKVRHRLQGAGRTLQTTTKLSLKHQILRHNCQIYTFILETLYELKYTFKNLVDHAGQRMDIIHLNLETFCSFKNIIISIFIRLRPNWPQPVPSLPSSQTTIPPPWSPDNMWLYLVSTPPHASVSAFYPVRHATAPIIRHIYDHIWCQRPWLCPCLLPNPICHRPNHQTT